MLRFGHLGSTQAPPANAGTPHRSNWMDPLAELFIRLEPHTNINAMQFILVGGVIDFARLRAAIDRVLPGHPLLLAAPAASGRRIEFARWSPGDVPLRMHEADMDFDFGSRPFRRFLTGLNRRYPIRWREMPPIQFHLVRSARSEKSCFVMLTTHSIADARSESLLLEQLFRVYGGRREPIDAAESLDPPGFPSFDRLFPDQLTPGRRWRRRLASQLHTMRAAFTRDLGSRLDWTPPSSGEIAEDLDFHNELLEPALEEAIWSTAKATGQTLNTVVATALVRVIAAAAVGRRGRKVRFNVAFSLRSFALAARRRDFRNFMVTCNIRVAPTGDLLGTMRSIADQVAALKRGGAFVEFEKIATGAMGLRLPIIDRLFLGLIDRVQGTTVSYSNPGVLEMPFDCFGDRSLPIEAYIASGCVVPPLHVIVSTPSIRGRLHLNAMYKFGAFEDFTAQLVEPLKRSLLEIAAEARGRTARPGPEPKSIPSTDFIAPGKAQNESRRIEVD